MLKNLVQTGRKLMGKNDDVGFGERGFFQRIIRPKQLESVFLFVTSRCNSKCRTCFYSTELNRPDDMNFEEILRLSRTAPSFDKLWLSGGEPFLRKELVDIIAAFVENNGIGTINLPTNGSLPDRIEDMTGQLLARCPDLHIHLNFSIDGFAASHDDIRGVPGGFEKSMESMERVAAAYGDRPKLHMNAATVLTPQNYDELSDLSRYLLRRFPTLGFHLSEPARGVSPDPSVQGLSRAQVEDIHERFRPVLDTIGKRMFSELPTPQRILAELSFTGILSFMHEVCESCHEGPSPWGMRCPAGETTIVIDADGSYRACEMRDKIGHMADHDYDLNAALNSPAMRAEVEAIGGGQRANCWCTHGCWISSSLKFAPRTLLTRVPLAYYRHRKNSSGPIDLAAVDLTKMERKYGL